MAADNPLRQIHAAMWTMLEANSGFTDLVKSSIKYTTTNRAPEKDEVSPSELPEVRIVATGLSPTVAPQLQFTSCSFFLTAKWEVQIASGDQRFETLFDVEWEVWRSLADWETHLKNLTWNSHKFVLLCRPLAIDTSLDDEKLNRGIRGWRSIWAGETQMYFKADDLPPT